MVLVGGCAAVLCTCCQRQAAQDASDRLANLTACLPCCLQVAIKVACAREVQRSSEALASYKYDRFLKAELNAYASVGAWHEASTCIGIPRVFAAGLAGAGPAVLGRLCQSCWRVLVAPPLRPAHLLLAAHHTHQHTGVHCFMPHEPDGRPCVVVSWMAMQRVGQSVWAACKEIRLCVFESDSEPEGWPDITQSSSEPEAGAPRQPSRAWIVQTGKGMIKVRLQAPLLEAADGCADSG